MNNQYLSEKSEKQEIDVILRFPLSRDLYERAKRELKEDEDRESVSCGKQMNNMRATFALNYKYR